MILKCRAKRFMGVKQWERHTMELDFLEWERRGGRDVGAESENITHAESLKILSLTMFNMGVKTFVKGEGGISLNGLASSTDAKGHFSTRNATSSPRHPWSTPGK